MNTEISNDRIKVLVSDLGAELQSIIKDGHEYLWDGDPKYWSSRSLTLFPYVGRFTENSYLLHGRRYGMEIHGFARNLIWKLVSEEKESMTYELRDTQETYAQYPYHFIFQITYSVSENILNIYYKIRNTSKETMFFGMGFHPGFRLPFDDGLDFSDYKLVFSEKCRPERIGHTKSLFLSGNDKEYPLEDGDTIRMRHSLFDEDAIVLRNMARQVTLESDKGGRKVCVSYPDMQYLGIWHAPKTDAPYVCIEPWTSIPSRQGVIEEFSCKSDLIHLDLGHEYENHVSITII